MHKKRILLAALGLLIAAALGGGGFFFGFDFGQEFPKTIVVRGVSNIDTPESVQADFGTFWQAWQLVEDQYLNNKDISNQEKVYGAVRGLIRSLNDPNTVFFTPEENKKFREDIRGNFSGIGAELGIRNDKLIIIAPLKDTPASRAGLEPGDHIVKINSTSTEGMSIERAVSLIRGPENTAAVLTISRKGWSEPREFRIIRGPISVPTLDVETKDGGIAYIKIYSFNASANFLFYRTAVKVLSDDAKGIVLDMRNNPGGYLDVAVDLAGWFLPRGTLVVKEASRDGTSKEFRASGNGAFAEMPIVVLINEGSASASEILAGTLRDNRGVKIVGEQSFGKGTVQQLESLRDNSSLKVTIAHWVLPKGQVLEGSGLKPDFEVKRTEEDIEKNRDPQLEKALQVLQDEMRAQAGRASR